MIVQTMVLDISLNLKANKRSFRGCVHRLRNSFYCFHLSHRNSLLSLNMQLHRCFESFITKSCNLEYLDTA